MSGAHKRARRIFNELVDQGLLRREAVVEKRFGLWWSSVSNDLRFADREVQAAAFERWQRVQYGTRLQQLTDRVTAERDNPRQEWNDAK